MRTSFFFASTVAVVLFASSDARPCSPPLPGLTGSIPADGESYPANAALTFQGFGLALDDVEVTIDGTPAGLVPASSLAELGGGLLAWPNAALVDPAPAAGQTVVLRGTFCDAGSASGGCTEKTISYTATAPDAAPPAKPEGVSYDVHDYVDFKSSGGDCQSDSDVAYWLHLPGVARTPDVARVAYRVDVFRDAALTQAALSDTFYANDGSSDVGLRALASALAGTALADACVRVQAFDLSGNVAAEATVVCDPCHVRADPAGEAPDSSPSQPAWGTADLWPGGVCASTGGTGGAGGSSGAGGAGGTGGTAGVGGTAGAAGSAGGTAGTNPGNDDGDDSSCTLSTHALGGRMAPWGWPAAALALLSLGARRATRRKPR